MSIEMASFTVALFVLCVVFTVCVLVLNVLSIVAIVKVRGGRLSNSNMFILNLAIIDILMMGPQLFFGTSALRGRISTLGLIFNAACFFTLTMAAMLNTFAIAVDRFLFIKKAMTYPSIVTSSRVRIAVLVIWVLAIFIGTISLYDIPFHKIVDEGVGQIIPDCENTTVQWLDMNRAQQPRNTTDLEHKVGFLDEMDIGVLLHQIASCPEAARPALIIQNMVFFVAFCILGTVTIGLYIQVFFVIREHNRTLATHTNLRTSNNIAHEYDSSECKIWPWYGESISSERYRIKNESKPSVFDTTLCLRIFRPCERKNVHASNDLIFTPTAPSATGSSCNQQSRNSSSSVSCNVAVTNSKDGEHRLNQDNSYGCDAISKENIQPSESRSAIYVKCRERKARFKLSIRSHLQDMRTVKTLGAMFVIYYICWLPMVICSFILYGLSHPITEQVMLGAWVIGTSNSIWNFLMYPMRNRELRTTITRLVCINRCRRSSKS